VRPEVASEVVELLAAMKAKAKSPEASRLYDTIAINVITGMANPQVMVDPLSSYLGLSHRHLENL
jgi:hypothetical protein